MPLPVSVGITQVHRWTDHLISFRTERPTGFRFTPGQFVRLGLGPEPQGIWRAYSLVSGPYDPWLEYYSIVVPDGAFTQPLSRLVVGDQLWMAPEAHGHLTLGRFPQVGDLWMLASGTGIAPFLSMLADPDSYEGFDQLVLVHSVRHAHELAYRGWIMGLASHELLGEYAHKLHYLPVVTRDAQPEGLQGSLHDRLPVLIQNGRLSDRLGLPMSPERSKFLLCGNPEMVQDTRKALKSLGFTNARQSTPGQIATENYW